MGGRRGSKAFTPAATIAAERQIAYAWEQSEGPFFPGPISVMIDYWLDGQEIAVREVDWHSTLRGDIDNYTKLTLDALQTRLHGDHEPPCAIANDSQVLSVQARKMPGRKFAEVES